MGRRAAISSVIDSSEYQATVTGYENCGIDWSFHTAARDYGWLYDVPQQRKKLGPTASFTSE